VLHLHSPPSENELYIYWTPSIDPQASQVFVIPNPLSGSLTGKISENKELEMLCSLGDTDWTAKFGLRVYIHSRNHDASDFCGLERLEMSPVVAISG
jgi:hypothetical protein